MKILSFAVSALLSSCASSEYPLEKVLPGGGVSSLPVGYRGDAYFWNGAYYIGGHHETGRFFYMNRFYNSRYMYDGTYLYGGNLKYIQGVNQYPSKRYSSARRAYEKHRYPQPFHHYPYH